MDNLTINTTNNGNKPSLQKPRSNFSQAAVSKGDVGDFQEGYFVMAEMPSLPQQRNKTHKTPERNQRKNEQRQFNTRERSTKDIELLLQRDSDSNFSNVRITTSPTRSPPRNKRIANSHSPQRHQQTTTHDMTHPVTLSPHKPRKAQNNFHEKRFVERSESTPPFSLESTSPPRDKGPSPPSTRWAGPAFSNAPPPSSLPIPDFPPFNPSQSTSSTPASPSLSSPIKSSPSFPGHSFASPHSQPIMMYHQSPSFIHHPSAYVPAAYQGYPLHLGHPHEMHTAQPASLAQLSTDLRRMLNINEHPVPIAV